MAVSTACGDFSFFIAARNSSTSGTHIFFMAIRLPDLSLLPLERYAAVLPPARMREVHARVTELADRLRGRVVWNVSSTAVGGGVAEMVRSLLAYARGAAVDARWVGSSR